MIRAGRLDRQIVIQSKTAAQGPAGEEQPTWSTWATVWASKSDKRGGEFFEAEQRVAERVTAFRIWYRAGVTEEMRVVYDGVTYEITAVQEIGRREGLELMCRAVNP